MKKAGKSMLIVTGVLTLGVAFFGFRSFKAQSAVPEMRRKLISCGEGQSDNCVSSAGPDKNMIEAWKISGDFSAVKNIVKELPRAELIDESDRFIHVAVRSLLFRYPDDVTLLWEGDRILVRSASRVGRKDFGVNRARLEAIAAQARSAGLIN